LTSGMTLALLAPLLAVVATGPAPIGRFHAAIVPTPGQDVAFEIQVTRKGDRLSATLINGASESPFTSAAWDGSSLTLSLANYDASITARPSSAGELTGTYERTTAAGRIE